MVSKSKQAIVIPENAIVTTNVTEENQEDVILELPMSSSRRNGTYKALLNAIRSGSLSDFQTISTAEGASVCEEDALSLLITACASNQTDIAKVAVGNVKDVNCYTYPYENPLLLAIKHKNIEIAMALIEAKADLNPRFKDEEDTLVFSPVFAAAKAGDPDVLRLIVKSGGDITAKIVGVRQAGKSLADVIDPHNEDMQEFLTSIYPLESLKLFVMPKTDLEAEIVRLNLSPDFKLTKYGLNPWLLACRRGLEKLLDRWFQQDAGVLNSVDMVRVMQFGMTGLMHAAMGRQEETCKKLVDWKASISMRNKWGKTAVHFAAESGNMDLVDYMNPSRELLNQKTEVRTRQIGETAMDYIAQFCFDDDLAS